MEQRTCRLLPPRLRDDVARLVDARLRVRRRDAVLRLIGALRVRRRDAALRLIGALRDFRLPAPRFRRRDGCKLAHSAQSTGFFLRTVLRDRDRGFRDFDCFRALDVFRERDGFRATDDDRFFIRFTGFSFDGDRRLRLLSSNFASVLAADSGCSVSIFFSFLRLFFCCYLIMNCSFFLGVILAQTAAQNICFV